MIHFSNVMFLWRRSKCFYRAEVNLCLCLYDIKASFYLYDVEYRPKGHKKNEQTCLYGADTRLAYKMTCFRQKIMTKFSQNYDEFRRDKNDDFRPKMNKIDGATS